MRSSACQNSKTHRREGRKGLRVHGRDRWRREGRTARKEGATQGANKGRREGRKEEKVGQTGRQTEEAAAAGDGSVVQPSLMCSTHTLQPNTHGKV